MSARRGSEVAGIGPEKNGPTSQGQLREHDGVWTLAGAFGGGADARQVRCTTRFGEAGASLTAKWEYASGESSWRTFWDVKATKEA